MPARWPPTATWTYRSRCPRNGGTGNGTNPEQLFVAGWAACFATSMAQVAKSKGIDVRDVAVTAEVSLV